MLDRKDIKFLLPIIPAYIVFCGLLNQILYYERFGINITSFLDLSEVLTLFVRDFILIAMMVVYGLILAFLGSDEKNELQMQEQWDKLKIELRFVKRLSIHFKRNNPILVVIVIMLLVTVYEEMFYKKYAGPILSILFLYSFMCVYTIIRDEYYLKYIKKYNKGINAKVNFALHYSVFFVIMVLFYTYIEVYTVKTSKRYMGVKFQLDNNIIVSDSTKYYIGKTKNYVFYFDEKEESTTVYPITRIKELTFKLNN